MKKMKMVIEVKDERIAKFFDDMTEFNFDDSLMAFNHFVSSFHEFEDDENYEEKLFDENYINEIQKALDADDTFATIDSDEFEKAGVKIYTKSQDDKRTIIIIY